MRKREKKFFISVLFIGAMMRLNAMDWPSSSANLTENFGADSKGKPSLGCSFAGDDVIRASETGELLFSRRDSETASRLPSPLGAWIAIDHGDGLISMYSRLDEEKTVSLPKSIEKDAVIASAGFSGWASSKGVHFSLFDRKERRWVNPGMVVSRFPDTRAPAVQATALRASSSNRTFDLPQTKNISQGRYTIFVTASDFTLSGDAALAPFRLVCFLNGREIGVIVFETFFARDGVLQMYRNGPAPVKQVYATAPSFEIGEAAFTRGQARLEIVVQDINENTQSAVYFFSVE